MKAGAEHLLRGVPAALLLLLLFAGAAGAADVVHFKNGRSLTGKIVAEDGETVTLELPEGGKITIPRRDIEDITRDAEGAEPPKVGDAGLIRVEHFLVWSGKRRVGTRSLWVRKRQGGGLQLEEESAFTDEEGKNDVRVRIVEIVDAALAPISIVYREISKGGQTLMEGTVHSGSLHLVVTVPGSRRESDLKLPEGVRFPLAAREFAVRERERLKGAWEAKVFDPREENFYLYRFENAGTQKVDWEGAVTEVTVLRRTRGARPPEEIWLDAAGRTLTEELNGPELVAVRTTKERLEAVKSGADVAVSPEERRVRPLYVNPDAGFSVRKPALSWVFKPGKPGEKRVLVISNVRWFAYVEVVVQPDLPEGGLVSSLAVDMEKRYSAASTDFKKLDECYMEVGGEKAYRMSASSRNRGEEIRSWLVGVLHGGHTWLISMACPKDYFEGAEPDFTAILGSFRFLD